MPSDDLTLIRRAGRNDDHEAFAELVRRYQSRLRYSLRQLTGYNEALADDLAQETFIKAYRRLDSFRGDAQFFTWLYRIAWRCFSDHCRRQGWQQADKPPPETGYSVGERDDLHVDFARALMRLPPEQRVAVHLHLHREFTHSEIAEIMGCPLGTVKSHIARGRLVLQKHLEDWKNQ